MNHTVVETTSQDEAQIAEAAEAHSVDAKLPERTQEVAGIGVDVDTIKEMISSVISGTLFESGLLQKFVSRSVEQKLEADGQSLSTQIEQVLREKGTEILGGALTEPFDKMRQELTALVQKESAAALSSENLKILIDDKFRAISIYLKTDVIPKTVSQMLKLAKKPGGA